jgi:hypothetical protein
MKETHWVPILEEQGLNEWDASHMEQYEQGVLDFVHQWKYYGQRLDIALYIRSLGEKNYQDVIEGKEQWVMDCIGDWMHSDEGISSRKYAPLLTKHDIDCYLEDEKCFKGINFSYSLKRSGEDIAYYYEQKVLEQSRILSAELNKIPAKTGDCLVLYGAGKKGKRLLREYKHLTDCHVIAWIDQNYKRYQEQGLNVMDVQSVSQLKFDYLIIGVVQGVEFIREDLFRLGVSKEKVFTSEEYRLMKRDEAES